jgi:hypothetical protein
VEVDNVALQELDESKSISPFRLTSFGVRDPDPPSQTLLEDNLQHLARVRSENLESMVLTLERLKAKARGFLSMTGSPLIEPVVRPLTASRLFVLFLLFAFVWLVLMIWLYPIQGNDWYRRRSHYVAQWASRLRGLIGTSETSASDFNQTIQWMQRKGIPYLGEIHVFSREENLSNSTLPALHPGVSEASPVNELICDDAVSQSSISWLRSMGEGSLVLWIGLFIARFMFDPTWRELVAVAPLAAISRMISGIQ